MEPFATIDHVENAWRPLTPAEQQVAQQLVHYASTMLRAQFSGLDDRIVTGKLSRDLVELAVVQMVRRAMQNPTRVRSESIDDYTVTYEQARAELEVTDAEARLLRPAGGRRPHVGSVRLTRGLR
jgi:hypothetical protein